MHRDRPLVCLLNRCSRGYPITVAFLLLMVTATVLLSLTQWRFP